MSTSSSSAAPIRRMFDAVSPRYDFLNHLLSAGIDRRWRAAAAERLRDLLPEGGGRRVLDVCTGTGDLAFAVLDAGCGSWRLDRSVDAGAGGGSRDPLPDSTDPPPDQRPRPASSFPVGRWRVLGADFSLSMLRRAREKARRRGMNGSLPLQAADALRLPFRDGAFDACTIAFGLRNLVDPAAGLREMRRVLRPGGWLLVLEFGNPRLPGLRQAYGLYFRRVLPWIGRMVSRSGTDAYDYLPRTVAAFPDREKLAAVMTEAGFEAAAFRPLTSGIAVLYEGRAPGQVGRTAEGPDSLDPGWGGRKSNAGHRNYIAVLRRMTPAQRLERAFDVSEFSRELFAHGLRKRFPAMSDDERHQLFLKRLDACRNRNC